MGDLLFTVYFDFQTTTTGDRIVNDLKMFVSSYCHPDLTWTR